MGGWVWRPFFFEGGVSGGKREKGKGRRGGERYVFEVDGFPRFCPFGFYVVLYVGFVELEFPLHASLFLFLFLLFSGGIGGDAPVAAVLMVPFQPHHRALKFPHAPLALLVHPPARLLLPFEPPPPVAGFQALHLLLLGQQVADDAFAAEDVAVGSAGDGGARRLQAQVAAREGQERVPGQARGLGAPGVFEEGALVRGEEGEGGVALALEGRLVG